MTYILFNYKTRGYASRETVVVIKIHKVYYFVYNELKRSFIEKLMN